MADPTPELTQFKTREEQDQVIRVSERPRRINTRGSVSQPHDTVSLSHQESRKEDIKDYLGLQEFPTVASTVLDEHDHERNAVQVNAEGKQIVTYPDGGFKAWSVVVGGFLLVFCGFGMTASAGAWNTYYTQNNLSQYPKSLVSWIGSLQSCLVFLLATISGSLFDRYGPRYLMIFGTVTIFAGYLALSWCTRLWEYFVVQSVVIALGMGMTFVCGVGSISEWFDERKGLAAGVVLSGGSLGSIVWPLLIANLPQKIGFGWTVRIIAFLELAMMGSATILIQSRLPRSKAGGRPLIMPKTFITHPAYSCLGISYFCFAFGYFFFLFYCGTFALNIGAGAAAPYVLIACNAASWLGRITSGFAADKVGYFNLLSLNLIAAFVIMFAWMSISSVTALFVAAIFYGIVTGGVIAMQVPASLITTKDLGCAGTLMGQIFGCQCLGILVGPPIAGYILGDDPDKQTDRFKWAIVMNGLFLALAFVFATLSRWLHVKKWLVVA